MAGIMLDVKNLFIKLFKQKMFLATVDSVDVLEINIIRNGQTVAEGPYPATDGLAAAVSPADVVLVMEVGGVLTVITKIVNN